jgi:hypothetical protein
MFADVIICLFVRPFNSHECHTRGVHQSPPGPKLVGSTDWTSQRLTLYLVLGCLVLGRSKIGLLCRSLFFITQLAKACFANGTPFEVMPGWIFFSAFAALHVYLQIGSNIKADVPNFAAGYGNQASHRTAMVLP